MQLAKVSKHYQQQRLKPSVQWGYEMLNYLRYNKAHLNDTALMQMLKGQQSHLKNLLPYENNPSYKSSKDALDKILNHTTVKPNPLKYEW